MRVSVQVRPPWPLLLGLIGILAVVGLLAAGSVQPILAQVVRAQTATAPTAGEVVVKAPQAVLMDAASGAIMFQRGADDLIYPASMSKLMLLAVTFKALKAGQIKLEDEFFMSEYAWRKGGAPSGTSAMMVPVGKKAKVDELLKGIIVQSGNDAAISVAENIAGNESLFAKRMTEEARQIGLKKSTFKNATGLPDPGHQMTARELALVARHIIVTYPNFYELFALKEFNYLKHKFINRNPLLTLVPGVDGLKTGFTKEAGYGMVASAKQDNRRLIAVVSGNTTADDRRDDAAGCSSGASAASRRPSCTSRRSRGPRARMGRQDRYVPLAATATSTSGCRATWEPRSSGRISCTNGR